MADGKIVYEVDYDVSKAKRDLKSFSSTLSDVSDKAGKIGSTLTKNVTAPMTAVGGAALAGFMKLSTELDSIAKSAAGVSATTEGLQALQFAGRKAGIETDKMTDTLKKVQELATSNGEAFWELGIQTRDMNGDMRSSDEIFLDLITKLDDMPTSYRNATLQGIGFNEELVTINQAMEDSVGFAENMEKGLDSAISDEHIQAFEEFNDKLEDLKLQLIPIALDIADALLPHLNDLADWLENDGIEKVGNFVEKLVDFVDENWKLIAALYALGPALQVFSGLAGFASNVSNLASSIGSATAAAKGASAAAGTAGASGAGGAAIGGGAAAGLAGLGIAGATVGLLAAADAAADYNISKYGGSGTGLTPAQRSAMFADSGGMYSDVRGLGDGTVISPTNLSSGQAQLAGDSLGVVNIAKVEVNTDTTLSPENQGALIDEIMMGVGDELTLRAVLGKP